MPRIANVRERRHQPFWDTLIRTTGNPTVPLQNSTNLFGNSNVGNLALTNLQVAGQLASDQTYVILALRAWLYFNGTNRRANYLRVNSQLYWTLIVGEKPMFQGSCWYFPAGGGTWGFDATATGSMNFINFEGSAPHPQPVDAPPGLSARQLPAFDEAHVGAGATHVEADGKLNPRQFGHGRDRQHAARGPR